MGTDATIPTVTLPDGRAVPALGLGTWKMGSGRRRVAPRSPRSGARSSSARRCSTPPRCMPTAARRRSSARRSRASATAVRGLEGAAVERVGRRDRRRLRAQPEAAAARAHRPVPAALAGRHPLAGTVEAFERLVAQGKIGAWGVSNFDVEGMRALAALPAGARCATNQVYYALSRRGRPSTCSRGWARGDAGDGLLPARRGRLVEHPRSPRSPELGATPAQVALAWLLAPGPHRTGVIAIPKTASVARVEENVAAAALRLSASSSPRSTARSRLRRARCRSRWSERRGPRPVRAARSPAGDVFPPRLEAR